MKIPIIILIALCVVLVVSLAVCYLIVSTIKLNKKLDDVKYEADEAETVEELEIVWDKLKEVNKECWHRTFGTRVMIIKTIIDTKYKMLSNGK